MTNELPKTLLEAVRYFSDTDPAFDFVVSLRWADGRPVCPRCGCLDQAFLKTRRVWKCKACKRQFSVKVGTIFEDSPVGFDKWLPAIWLVANSKNSISSYEVARSIVVTQKTAWFMLHRIRAAMATGTFQRFSGTVEVDKTYIGDLADNMHRRDRDRKITARGHYGKIPVQGARERGSGRVAATHCESIDKYVTQVNLRRWIEDGSALYTDESSLYGGAVERHYAYKSVNHQREYVSGDVTTTGSRTSGRSSSALSRERRSARVPTTCSATSTSGRFATTIATTPT